MSGGFQRRRFFARWIAWVAIGEFVGFLAPLGAEAVNLALALPDVPSALLLAVAGAGEGAVLGAAQGARLGRELPTLNRGRFVAWTAGSAAAAWALGELPVAAEPVWITWHPVLVGVAGFVVVVLLLASIGTGQWLELRRAVPGAWRWIAATAAAWCAGLGVFFAVATPLWTEGQPTVLILAIGALAAAAMAVAMAAVTGVAALALVSRTYAVPR